MVGRDTLVPILGELAGGKSLRLSTFATQDEKGRRYFKNRLGGLGQYYLGTLEELGILTGRKGQFIQYDPVLGVEIARRFDAGVPGKLFWDTITGDFVTEKLLKQLAPFCPCQLMGNKPEYSWLTDLFFGRLADDDASRFRRSQSLGLVLHLTQAIASDPDATIEPMTFRDACYSGSLPSGAIWNIPEAFVGIRNEWRLYERNELLSISAQSLLTMFVRSLELMSSAPAGAREVAQFLLGSNALRRHAKKPWGQFVDERRRVLPLITKPDSSHHELRLAQRLFDIDTADGELSDLGSGVECALQILASLILRSEKEVPPAYGDLPITETMLADYPINLIAFRKASGLWNGMTVAAVTEWLVYEWASETHLRIALRKLRSEHLDTFRFYPTDLGLKPREVPPFGYSNPRVRQAIQILRDLAALAADARGRLQITAAGRALLKAVCQN